MTAHGPHVVIQNDGQHLLPVISEQLRDEHALHDDATLRGWTSEAKRHEQVIQALNGHLNRTPHPDPRL